MRASRSWRAPRRYRRAAAEMTRAMPSSFLSGASREYPPVSIESRPDPTRRPRIPPGRPTGFDGPDRRLVRLGAQESAACTGLLLAGADTDPMPTSRPGGSPSLDGRPDKSCWPLPRMGLVPRPATISPEAAMRAVTTQIDVVRRHRSAIMSAAGRRRRIRRHATAGRRRERGPARPGRPHQLSWLG